MSWNSILLKQLKQNQLAVMSLVIAIGALSYNSWRNELSEENRNFRTAGFEILREASKLQLVVDLSTYTENSLEYDPIHGWVSVNLILSLSEVLPEPVQVEAKNLKQAWSEDWSEISKSEKANHNISRANESLVNSVKQLIVRLN